MSKKLSDLSPSMQIAAKTVYATFKILKDAGGHLPGREVIDKIRELSQRYSMSDSELVNGVLDTCLPFYDVAMGDDEILRIVDKL